jgi:hypothetical protein
MATITVTIPDPVAPRVIDALSIGMGYQTTIDGNPNPETKGAFAKRQLILWVMAVVKNYEASIGSADINLS